MFVRKPASISFDSLRSCVPLLIFFLREGMTFTFLSYELCSWKSSCMQSIITFLPFWVTALLDTDTPDERYGASRSRRSIMLFTSYSSLLGWYASLSILLGMFWPSKSTVGLRMSRCMPIRFYCLEGKLRSESTWWCLKFRIYSVPLTSRSDSRSSSEGRPSTHWLK